MRSRILPDDVAGETAPRSAPDARADFLHRRHQRIGDDHRPKQTEAIERTGLRICGNAAGVIVRSAGDQPGAKHIQQAGFAGADGSTSFRIGVLLGASWLHCSSRFNHNVGSGERVSTTAAFQSNAGQASLFRKCPALHVQLGTTRTTLPLSS